MGRTTLGRDLIELIRVGKIQKDVVLAHLADASHGAEQLRRGPPAVTVLVHVLRSRPRISAEMAMGIARGTVSFPVVDPIYDVTMRVSLYALTDVSRVDVLTFGRHPSQDIQILDAMVSREHGLVILAGHIPLFCDYGTLIDGKHAGSTNGTYLNGASLIRDTMISWLPGYELMLGQQYSDREGFPLHSIKLTYELHPPGN